MLFITAGALSIQVFEGNWIDLNWICFGKDYSDAKFLKFIQSLYPWKKLTRRNERHLVIKLCTCIITLFFYITWTGFFFKSPNAFHFFEWGTQQWTIEYQALSYRYWPSVIRCKHSGPLVCGSTKKSRAMFYFLAFNSGSVLSGNAFRYIQLPVQVLCVGTSMQGTSANLFDSYLQEYMWKKQTQRQHFWKYSLLDIILLQHVR